MWETRQSSHTPSNPYTNLTRYLTVTAVLKYRHYKKNLGHDIRRTIIERIISNYYIRMKIGSVWVLQSGWTAVATRIVVGNSRCSVAWTNAKSSWWRYIVIRSQRRRSSTAHERINNTIQQSRFMGNEIKGNEFIWEFVDDVLVYSVEDARDKLFVPMAVLLEQLILDFFPELNSFC